MYETAKDPTEVLSSTIRHPEFNNTEHETQKVNVDTATDDSNENLPMVAKTKRCYHQKYPKLLHSRRKPPPHEHIPSNIQTGTYGLIAWTSSWTR